MAKKNKYNPHPQVIVRQNNYYFLNHEKIALEAHYDFLMCQIKPVKGKLCLVATGQYNQVGITYTYEIIYDGYNDPDVRILSPALIEKPPHTYPKDRTLCLYHPKDTPWSNRTCSLYSHIIPWVHEWILYYEIYLINGKWEHPEAKHGTAKDRREVPQ